MLFRSREDAVPKDTIERAVKKGAGLLDEGNQIEEILHKAMPLGSISNYVYKEQELALAPGDVVVLMSDGLPERFNDAGEMLGYETTTAMLAEMTTLTATEIIAQFVQRGDAWANGKPQDDDVTFVVVKVR